MSRAGLGIIANWKPARGKGRNRRCSGDGCGLWSRPGEPNGDSHRCGPRRKPRAFGGHSRYALLRTDGSRPDEPVCCIRLIRCQAVAAARATKPSDRAWGASQRDRAKNSHPAPADSQFSTPADISGHPPPKIGTERPKSELDPTAAMGRELVVGQLGNYPRSQAPPGNAPFSRLCRELTPASRVCTSILVEG